MENIYMIVAMTEKTNAIGIKGSMIYHLKNDLKYFKETTLNHTIICGRKTYMSFPKRPLPQRENIVLTQNDIIFDGASVLHSKDDVINYASENMDKTIFIVGGDSVYSQFMDIASKLYVTVIEEEIPVEADTFFPNIDMNIWNIESISEKIEEENTPGYRYFVYSRK